MFSSWGSKDPFQKISGIDGISNSDPEERIKAVFKYTEPLALAVAPEVNESDSRELTETEVETFEKVLTAANQVLLNTDYENLFCDAEWLEQVSTVLEENEQLKRLVIDELGFLSIMLLGGQKIREMGLDESIEEIEEDSESLSKVQDHELPVPAKTKTKPNVQLFGSPKVAPSPLRTRQETLSASAKKNSRNRPDSSKEILQLLQEIKSAVSPDKSAGKKLIFKGLDNDDESDFLSEESKPKASLPELAVQLEGILETLGTKESEQPPIVEQLRALTESLKVPSEDIATPKILEAITSLSEAITEMSQAQLQEENIQKAVEQAVAAKFLEMSDSEDFGTRQLTAKVTDLSTLLKQVQEEFLVQLKAKDQKIEEQAEQVKTLELEVQEKTQGLAQQKEKIEKLEASKEELDTLVAEKEETEKELREQIAELEKAKAGLEGQLLEKVNQIQQLEENNQQVQTVANRGFNLLDWQWWVQPSTLVFAPLFAWHILSPKSK